jgi:hypothetical protein
LVEKLSTVISIALIALKHESLRANGRFRVVDTGSTRNQSCVKGRLACTSTSRSRCALRCGLALVASKILDFHSTLVTEVYVQENVKAVTIWTMGGHSAWRKRVARGELAKGSGGAICRHRPHFGRKGKEREKERKGNIAGGNPKKKEKSTEDEVPAKSNGNANHFLIIKIIMAIVIIYLAPALYSSFFHQQRGAGGTPNHNMATRL